jgi:hypothetical protein
LPGFEKDRCRVCSVRNLQTLDRPIHSNIIFGTDVTNQSVSNFRPRCPIKSQEFEHCPKCTPEEADVQSTILNVYAEAVMQITGHRLKLYTLAGSQSGVDLILNQLNQDFIDFCPATTHVQNLSTRIEGFDKRNQRMMVVCVLTQISQHLKSNCVEGGSLIDSAFADPNMKYASYCEYIPDDCSFIEQFLTYIKQFSKHTRESVPLVYYKLPVSVYRFYKKKRDLIVEYAKIHYDVPVGFDANQITLSILHSYIGHLGGSAPRNLGGSVPKNMQQAEKGGVCVEHGAKQKCCSHEGCAKGVRKGGVCFEHGEKCSHEGCANGSVKGGVCRRHGAKQKCCSHEGCAKGVQKGGVCVAHGAELKRCSHEGCDKHVVKGGVCVEHGAEKKRCSHEGCPNQVQKGGVCISHGAERKRCSHKGCPNGAVKGGVCISHGTKKRKRCSHEGCPNGAVKGGVCISHGV